MVYTRGLHAPACLRLCSKVATAKLKGPVSECTRHQEDTPPTPDPPCSAPVAPGPRASENGFDKTVRWPTAKPFINMEKTAVGKDSCCTRPAAFQKMACGLSKIPALQKTKAVWNFGLWLSAPYFAAFLPRPATLNAGAPSNTQKQRRSRYFRGFLDTF